jgi:hypothetical protein
VNLLASLPPVPPTMAGPVPLLLGRDILFLPFLVTADCIFTDEEHLLRCPWQRWSTHSCVSLNSHPSHGQCRKPRRVSSTTSVRKSVLNTVKLATTSHTDQELPSNLSHLSWCGGILCSPDHTSLCQDVHGSLSSKKASSSTSANISPLALSASAGNIGSSSSTRSSIHTSRAPIHGPSNRRGPRIQISSLLADSRSKYVDFPGLGKLLEDNLFLVGPIILKWYNNLNEALNSGISLFHGSL